MSAKIMKACRLALAGSALLALTACNLAPTYVRPDLPVAQSLPQGATYPTLADGATGVDGIGWQAFFTDQQLKDTIALALASNRDLRSAVAAVAQARALYRVDRAALVPKVTAGPSASAQRARGVTTETYQLSGGVSAFEIDLFGRLRNTSKAAFETYLASDEGRKATQISVVTSKYSIRRPAWSEIAPSSGAVRNISPIEMLLARP